jgi:hypothetical protein
LPNTPHTKNDEPGLDGGLCDDDSSDRPTVAPPFDLESYAKQTAAASTIRPDNDLRPTLPSGANQGAEESRPSSLSPPGKQASFGSLEERIDQMFDDAFYEGAPGPHSASGAAVTVAPPAGALSSVGGRPSNRATERAQKPGPLSDPVSRRDTPPAGQQVEQARALSAREDTGRGTVLSLANMRIPSRFPPRQEPEDPVLTIGTTSLDGESGVPEEAEAEKESDPRSEMRERFALGDYSGALAVAESLLEENATDAEAREYAESCQAVLYEMYAAKIGPLTRVPVVEVARDQLRWLSIDHRAGFMLSLVDGVSSLEMILDVSGMPSQEALRILHELVEQRIISLRTA